MVDRHDLDDLEEEIDELATRLIVRLRRLERLTDGWLDSPKPSPKPEEPPIPAAEDPDYELLKEQWDKKRLADELAWLEAERDS